MEQEITKGKLQHHTAFLKKHVFEINIDGSFVREIGEGRIGTHSIRKLAPTYAAI